MSETVNAAPVDGMVMPWWESAVILVREIRRFEGLAASDEPWSHSGYYREYFSNCVAENRRHEDRLRGKLFRLLRRSGIEA